MRKQLSLLLLLLSTAIYAQKEANIWYFGNNAGIDFSTEPPTALTNGQLNTDEGCSSFSSANGDLLFYSDGISVYNKDHQLMRYTNGSLANNLKGNPSSTQSGMIIPKPNSTDIYYLFTVGTDFVPQGVTPNPGFNYYTIDMSKNSGLGEIIDGPVNLAVNPINGVDLSNAWSEKVTSVKAKDCNAFWVLSFVDDTFYAYKIDQNGVDVANPVLSRMNFRAEDKRGYLQVSPDGKKIAFADFNAVGDSNITGSLLLFDFDNDTGLVNPSSSQRLILPFSGEAPYGVAFSQQSNKLYASTFNGRFSVFQFDLTANPIINSKRQIRTKNGYRGALQLGPNGKIYVSVPSSRFLDVIENPNEDAQSIIYSDNAINLNGRFTTQGLPPFISSLLLPIEIKDQATSKVVNNQTLQFCTSDSINIAPDPVSGNNVTYLWTFDNGSTVSTVSNTINLNLPNIDESIAGEYKLLVTLTDDCGNNVEREGTFKIEVYQATSGSQPTDIYYCDTDFDGFNSFDLQNDVTPQVLNGQDSNIFEVVYYTNQNDANNNTVANALPNPYTNTTAFSNQTIYARMHNKVAPNACYDIKTFLLTITGKPNPQTPSDYEVCDDTASGSDTDGFYNSFLLSTKDSEILGSLSTSTYYISYHKTLNGAETDRYTDVIDKNMAYRNETTESQTVYVRVENILNTACTDTSVSFKLMVNSLPVISSPVTLKQCDDDTDAFAYFNLEEVQQKISDDYVNESFSFYETLYNAQNNISPITDPTRFRNRTVTQDTIWTTVTNVNGCKRISEVNLLVSTTGIPSSFHRTFKACDDFLNADGTINNNPLIDNSTDGITSFDFSSVDAEIRNLFSAVGQQIHVTYYENEIDAATEKNAIADISNYRNINSPVTQNIYVRVDSELDNDCLGFGHHITLNVNPLPEFSVESPKLVCLNNPQTRLEPLNPQGNYDYSWRLKGSPALLGNNDFLDVSHGGVYILTATTKDGNGCERSKEITVNESINPTLQDANVVITDDTSSASGTYTIQVLSENNSLGIGDYQFSLVDEEGNQSPFQDSPFFGNLRGGIYTIVVNDKNGCTPDATLDVSVIEYPKFITPNNDGYNDTWRIKGVNSNFYPNSTIYIFDRYGKAITTVGIDSEGWDGTFDGKPLPSNDYWFKVQLTDKRGKVHLHNGHFSLLRK